MPYYSSNNKESLSDYIRKNFPFFFGSLCNISSAFLEKKNIEKDELDQLIREIESKALDIAQRTYSQEQPFDEWQELDQKIVEFNKRDSKREIGRYSASELWALLNNRTPPEKYFEEEVKTPQELWKMSFGTFLHNGLQKLFDFQEKKYEILIQKEPKIVIVCKIDLEDKGNIYEFKSRESVEFETGIPLWNAMQCEAYCRATNKDEINLWVVNLSSRKKYVYQKNDVLWESITAGVKNYDKKLRALWQTTK